MILRRIVSQIQTEILPSETTRTAAMVKEYDLHEKNFLKMLEVVSVLVLLVISMIISTGGRFD